MIYFPVVEYVPLFLGLFCPVEVFLKETWYVPMCAVLYFVEQFALDNIACRTVHKAARASLTSFPKAIRTILEVGGVVTGFDDADDSAPDVGVRASVFDGVDEVQNCKK